MTAGGSQKSYKPVKKAGRPCNYTIPAVPQKKKEAVRAIIVVKLPANRRYILAQQEPRQENWVNPAPCRKEKLCAGLL